MQPSYTLGVERLLYGFSSLNNLEFHLLHHAFCALFKISQFSIMQAYLWCIAQHKTKQNSKNNNTHVYFITYGTFDWHMVLFQYNNNYTQLYFITYGIFNWYMVLFLLPYINFHLHNNKLQIFLVILTNYKWQRICCCISYWYMVRQIVQTILLLQSSMFCSTSSNTYFTWNHYTFRFEY